MLDSDVILAHQYVGQGRNTDTSVFDSDVILTRQYVGQ